MLQAGFSIIADQAPIVFSLLLLIVLSQILISLSARFLLAHRPTSTASTDSLALGLSGWILPASLASLIGFYLGFGFALAFLVLPILALLFFFRLKPDPEPFASPQGKPASKNPSLILLLFLILLSFSLRLVFVARAVLPSYFDSAQHYLLIKNLVVHHAALSANYYHLGFHFLTAFIVSSAQANIAQTMLILGGLILALLPVSIFFLIRHAAQSNPAGFFAVSLAAFGWYMPAHAMDWGKYPALMGLALMPFTLSLFYLVVQNRNTISRGKLRALLILLGMSVILSELAHSRSVIVYGIVLIAWIISTWANRLPRIGKALVLGFILIAMILEANFIQREPVFGPLFDPYLNKGLWITLLVLLLSIFALRDFSQLVLICLLAICFLLGGLFIPVRVPGYGNLTVLDRPFVEMILFLPLAIMGGLGWAGLEKSVPRAATRIGAVLVLASLTLIHGLVRYDWYPSDCCVIAGNDDVAAIAWMKNHLPPNSSVGVSAVTLNVLASDSFEGYVGGDAGIWITPLSDRAVIPLSFDTNFDQPETLDELCQKNISHLYVGELGQTFNDAQIHAHPEWYQMLLSMPKVRVYQVVGCG